LEIAVSIRTIGNSKGIILPKQYLDEFGFGDKAVLEVDAEAKTFTLRTAASPRQGWAEALESHPPEPLSAEDRAWLDFKDNWL